MNSVSTKRLLRVWIAFFWRATIIGFLAGGLIGGLIGMIMASMNLDQYIVVVSSWAGFFVGIPVSMWAFVSALTASYKKFDIIIQDRSIVGETFD